MKIYRPLLANNRVVDGRTEGVILNESEAAWIRACWLAVVKHWVW